MSRGWSGGRPAKPKVATNFINHVVLLLDESSSMNERGKAQAMVKVADEQVRYLAKRSQEMGQETRVTIYGFSYGDDIRCMVFDMDVLRLPSIAEIYHAYGNTALIDATLLALRELGQTAQMHGDHAFLVYVLTDGMENDSIAHPPQLRRAIMDQDENWTLAVMVPDRAGKAYAIDCGFPDGNIDIWDASSAKGLEDSFVRIRKATDDYMAGRAVGVRGTRTLFSTGVEAVNEQTVAAANLTPLKLGQCELLDVTRDASIRDFVENSGRTFITGRGYYQLTKTENIQAQKEIAIVRKSDGKVFVGRDARALLGLPDMNVRVRPQHNPLFDVYVQSTSVNRRLVGGTKLLLLK